MTVQLKDPSLLRQQCYIDGKWVDADSGDTVEVTNPANGEVIATVPRMGADETRAAIDAANRAWPAWRALTAKERAIILRKWFNLVIENATAAWPYRDRSVCRSRHAPTRRIHPSHTSREYRG